MSINIPSIAYIIWKITKVTVEIKITKATAIKLKFSIFKNINFFSKNTLIKIAKAII